MFDEQLYGRQTTHLIVQRVGGEISYLMARMQAACERASARRNDMVACFPNGPTRLPYSCRHVTRQNAGHLKQVRP
jgi:hypothetical protein